MTKTVDEGSRGVALVPSSRRAWVTAGLWQFPGEQGRAGVTYQHLVMAIWARVFLIKKVGLPLARLSTALSSAAFFDGETILDAFADAKHFLWFSLHHERGKDRDHSSHGTKHPDKGLQSKDQVFSQASTHLINTGVCGWTFQISHKFFSTRATEPCNEVKEHKSLFV